MTTRLEVSPSQEETDRNEETQSSRGLVFLASLFFFSRSSLPPTDETLFLLLRIDSISSNHIAHINAHHIHVTLTHVISNHFAQRPASTLP
ncbi:unnamed protein product [Caenorhabditis nigoni]